MAPLLGNNSQPCFLRELAEAPGGSISCHCHPSSERHQAGWLQSPTPEHLALPEPQPCSSLCQPREDADNLKTPKALKAVCLPKTMQLAPSPVVAAAGQGHSLAPEHHQAVGSTFELQLEQLGEAGGVQEQGRVVPIPASPACSRFPCSAWPGWRPQLQP